MSCVRMRVVPKQNSKFTNTLCSQNKNKTVSLQTRYDYKTKKTERLEIIIIKLFF